MINVLLYPHCIRLLSIKSVVVTRSQTLVDVFNDNTNITTLLDYTFSSTLITHILLQSRQQQCHPRSCLHCIMPLWSLNNNIGTPTISGFSYFHRQCTCIKVLLQCKNNFQIIQKKIITIGVLCHVHIILQIQIMVIIFVIVRSSQTGINRLLFAYLTNKAKHEMLKITIYLIWLI